MAPVNHLDAVRASIPYSTDSHQAIDLGELGDFEAELQRLAAANQELMGEIQAPADAPEASDELAELRHENAELRTRLEELEAALAGQDEEQWLERQREYETLLEEKSEVIRNLHLKIQEIQESALGSEAAMTPAPSGVRVGQAEEILRLKRELEAQRRQLQQDEEDMMAQMRQMEIAMAKERAELARQKQEVTRLQAELNREVENAGRDPELRNRLNTLRRHSDPKLPVPGSVPTPNEQKSSGFFRRIFG